MSSQQRTSHRVGIAQRTDAKGRKQYRGTVYDRQTGKHLRGPWTYNFAEARSWRVDALARLQAGTLSGDRGMTVREAAAEFVHGVESGAIRTARARRTSPPQSAATAAT
jgi:hypothetical protein